MHLLHSLFFDLVCGGAGHRAGVFLSLAAMPQVDESFVNVEKYHGGARAQSAAVARHLQQVALYWHLTTHTVQTPLAWRRAGGRGGGGKREEEVRYRER